jgi:hypothetical protein
LEKDESVDKGPALKERIGVKGDEGLVDEGDEEAEDEQVKLEKAEVLQLEETVIRSDRVIACVEVVPLPDR